MRVWLTAFFWKREVIYIVRLWQDLSTDFANDCAIFEVGASQVFVGSSSTRPLMKTMSVVSNVFASLGFGSNVCELVPSGTMPVTSVPVPPAMLATMLVIGATVVAMVSTPVMGAPISHPIATTPFSVVVPHEATKLTIAIAAMDFRINFMRQLYVSTP